MKVIEPAGNWTQQLYSIAYIYHSVTYGTWSFDIFVDYDRPMVVFWRFVDGHFSIIGRYFIGSRPWTNCWNHFDVTRDSTGYFNIYLNETLILSHSSHTIFLAGILFLEVNPDRRLITCQSPIVVVQSPLGFDTFHYSTSEGAERLPPIL